MRWPSLGFRSSGSNRTAPRANGLSLDFGEMERQDGDVPTPAFSFLNGRLEREQTPCYLTYTNDDDASHHS
jgi:tRNA uridine 5-carboxymethylaminomethyl modification enzyme